MADLSAERGEAEVEDEQGQAEPDSDAEGGVSVVGDEGSDGSTPIGRGFIGREGGVGR